MARRSLIQIGQKFGRLTVIGPAEPSLSGKPRWKCRCDCGKITRPYTQDLRSGHTKSCGCLQKEMTSKCSAKDITGQTFGRLTALYPTEERRNEKIMWRCRCIEGNEIEVATADLIKGHTQSCGCLQRELTAQRVHRHGEAIHGNETSLYINWKHIKARCLNPKDPSFINYGGRGITMAPEFKDYIAFRDYVNEHLGPRPSPKHSIDRKENDWHYVPGNLRWATPLQQSQNKRRSLVNRTFCGTTLKLA